MEELILLTDGSVNVKTKIGYGAYLLVKVPLTSQFDKYKKLVKLKRFENTSSSRLEVETLLWAIDELKDFPGKIRVYTDSQNLFSLPERKQKLGQTNYQNSDNKLLKNHKLYKEFFEAIRGMDIDFVKIKGHQPKSKKNDIDLLFSLVDKASRKALRREKFECN